MIVDYDWVKSILNGSLGYVQYNELGTVVGSTASAGRINYFDIKFNVSKTLFNPWFVLTDVGPDSGYFTYSTSSSGPFTNSLSIDLDTVSPNGTIRIYVKIANSYSETKHIKSQLKLTPGGVWKPPTWLTDFYGYDLYAPPASPLTFRYYDSSGTERGVSINGYDVGYVDVILTLNDAYPNASFTITDTETAGNSDNLFKISFNQNGGWSDSLTWTPNVTRPNMVGQAGTLSAYAARVFIQVTNPLTYTQRPTSRLSVNGNVAGQARNGTSAVYGKTLPGVPTNVIGFRYYDSSGVERGGDINNYDIGFIDVVATVDNTYPNASFTITDTESNGNLFHYSFSSAGPFVDSLNWNPGAVSNGTAARVYVQFIDPQTGVQRAGAQLQVSGSINGQSRNATSIVYGDTISQIPYLQPAKPRIIGDMTPDDTGYCYFNMRTGHIRVSVSQGGGSKAGTFYVDGQEWVTNLAYPGDSDNYNVQIPVEKDFPNSGNPNIAQASSVTAWLTDVTGRQKCVIDQAPTAANDFTVRVFIDDPAGGPGHYRFTINTQVS